MLAGGLPQIALIKELKSRNITTVLADGSDQAIARPYADKFYQIPIFDIDAVKDVAILENVDFLITVCADQVLLVVAQVSEMLGLPCYLDYDTAIKVSDKELMKNIFAENNIPTAQHVVLNTFDLSSISHLKYPLVVKPVDSYSSRGVIKVMSEKELPQAFEEALKVGRTGSVVVEEFCEGEEISVDVYVSNDRAHVLCVSNSEKIDEDGRFVIYRGKYPVENISENLLEKIKHVCQRIADVFGISNAPMLVQMISDGENVSVLEFCARTGGAMKYLLIKRACGFDVIRAVVDLTLGEKPEVVTRESESPYIINDFIYCRRGTFDHLSGFEELLQDGTLADYHCLKSKGAVMKDPTSSGDRIAGITIKAESVEEFNEKQKRILDKVKVIDCNGNDMMRHDLLQPLS